MNPAPRSVKRVRLVPYAQMSRWGYALRFHRSSQLLRRCESVLRRRFDQRHAPSRWHVDASARLQSLDLLRRVAQQRIEHFRDPGFQKSCVDPREGRITLLGHAVDCGLPPAWTSQEVQSQARLWQFHLHYQEWLFALHALGTPKASEQIWEAVSSWIDSVSAAKLRDSGDAFHPFCISRRIPVWLCLLAMAPPSAALQSRVLRSVSMQAAFLSRHLEKDLGGNHLLENARALIFAGLAVDSRKARRWFDLGSALLKQQLAEQVLEHGEHFERAPMYHVEMLELTEEVQSLTSEEDPELSSLCGEYAERMAAFLRTVSHPDGDIPLFGDSVHTERNVTSDSAARPCVEDQPVSATSGEYWTFRHRDDFLVFDAAPAGPDHLPAHAHADLLTLEASVGGKRLLVDSGVFDYEAGAMRRYCRSTAAHNVLEIDGENQCDVWSRFRMGRRGWPSALQCGLIGEACWGGATHDAYRHRSVDVVGRFLHCAAGDWLICDWALGRGTHTMVNRLHLHPDSNITRLSESLVRIELNETVVFLRALGEGELKLRDGWYCPRFGERLSNTVLEFHATRVLPAVVGWRLTRDQAAAEVHLTANSNEIIVTESASGASQFSIDPRSARILHPLEKVGPRNDA